MKPSSRQTDGFNRTYKGRLYRTCVLLVDLLWLTSGTRFVCPLDRVFFCAPLLFRLNPGGTKGATRKRRKTARGQERGS